jgi:predicted transcriptional regulator of viral defense system
MFHLTNCGTFLKETTTSQVATTSRATFKILRKLHKVISTREVEELGASSKAIIKTLLRAMAMQGAHSSI